MSYRCIKEPFCIESDQDLFDKLRCLYDSTGNRNTEIDESDLVIFRLMGAQFTYAAVVFEEISPAS